MSHFFVFTTFSFDVNCDLLLNRLTTKWDLFAIYMISLSIYAFWLILACDQVDTDTDGVTTTNILLFF